MVDLSGKNNSKEQNEPVPADQPENPTTGEAMPSKAQSTPASSDPGSTGDESPGESTTVHTAWMTRS